MTYPEHEILKPRDAALTDENSWEEFDLLNVTANDSANVLLACEAYPVTIRGALQLDEEQTDRLYDQSQGDGTVIEIYVTHISYGEFEDGELGIWVAGQAGWYRLKTAKRSYQPVFDHMTKAVELHYFLTDQYESLSRRSKAKSKKPMPGARAVFAAYAKERKTCQTPADAETVFGTHRQTLICFMLQKREHSNWSATPFYRHLKSAFPADFEEAQARLDGATMGKLKPKLSAEPTKTSHSKSEASDIQDVDEYYRTQVVWRVMKASLAGIPAKSRTIDAVASQLTQQFSLPSHQIAVQYIQAHASVLIGLMNEDKSLEWTEQPIYRSLTKSNLPPHTVKSVIQTRFRRRPDIPSTPMSGQNSDSGPDDAGRLESNSGPVTPLGRTARGSGKTTPHPSSSLRPKSQYSGKKRPPPNYDEFEDEYYPKRQANGSRGTLGDSSSDDAGLEDDSEPDDKATEAARQLPVRSTGPTPRLRSTTAPDLDGPNAPGDVWACPRDGCLHRVYAASSDEGKGLIHKHWANEHGFGAVRDVSDDEDDADEDDDARMRLLKREGLGRGMPVDRLMQRIRQAHGAAHGEMAAK